MPGKLPEGLRLSSLGAAEPAAPRTAPATPPPQPAPVQAAGPSTLPAPPPVPSAALIGSPAAVPAPLQPSVPQAPTAANAPLPPASAIAPPPAQSAANHIPTVPGKDEASTAASTVPTVSAASARIQGDVKLGRSQRHVFFVIGVPLVAMLLLTSGLFLALSTFDANQTRGPSADLTSNGGTLAFATPIDRIGELTSTAAVTLQLNGCGIRDTASGVVLDDRTVLASRSQVLTDATPLIQTADGTVVRGVVVGWNVPRDLAVIRTEEPLPSGLTWGVSTRLREGIEVFVADISDPTNVAVAEVKVDQVRSRDGIAIRMDFESTAPSPSPVFDSDGLVIGITSKPGQAEPANAVRGYVSRAIVDDRRPNAICPPPPPTTVPATDEAPTDG